ncbi:MAG TPA: hypothetical protein VM618_09230 [Acidimicrobiia bacterium]|nr:hypothetical protein [Acidimicrobiia bacterium]
MERAPGNPVDLLAIWMQWENGETPPGKVISDLKAAGMRELLDTLAEQAEAAAPEAEG